MPDNNAVRSSGLASDERIRNALRRHIQRAYDGGEFTRATLAEESGVSLCQLDQIMASDPSKHRRITAEDALNLAYTLGGNAVNAVLATIRYSGKRLDDADQQSVHLIVASGLQHFSTIATAAADGRIDHTERPRCQDAADQIIATVLPLSSAGGTA